MNKEKALKNQGLEFREDINKGGGTARVVVVLFVKNWQSENYAAAEMAVA